jgi:hypothetical protein
MPPFIVFSPQHPLALGYRGFNTEYKKSKKLNAVISLLLALSRYYFTSLSFLSKPQLFTTLSPLDHTPYYTTRA